ncbi:transcriptional regulator family: C2H2 zinc finger and Fungal Specific TF [Penicillium sp. IBT 31633x]|nr:transcriptional regulator family: C2H2 zinc finger and Fungal Specific TF [Penicillium sp. IBT 31633x]
MHTSAFPLDGNGQNDCTQSPALHTTQHTRQDSAGVQPDIMEISDNSENDENHLTSQALPPNTTRAPNPRAPAPASSARARARARARGPAAASAAPAAPAAANPSRPTRQVLPALPKLRRMDERFLLPEHCYTIKLNPSIYESLTSYLVKLGYPEDATFPWWRVVNDFMHLYFEHFDHDYPVVHPYTLESGNDKTSWILLLAVIAVGSQYSMFSNANLFSAHLADILSEAIARSVSLSPGEDHYIN